MKHIYFIFILFVIPYLATAQIEIDYNDFAKPGENFIMAIDIFHPSQKVKIENFKNGNTWDFSGLQADSYDTIRHKLPEDTKYDGLFTPANFVKHYKWSKIHYWELTEDKLIKVGVIEDYLMFGNPAYIYFTENILQYRFPIRYGNTYGDTVSFRFTSAYSKQYDSIKCFVNVLEHTTFDDYGSVKTVMGTYEVIREKHIEEKSVRVNKHNIYNWIPAPELTKSVVNTTYRWYAKNEGIPVVEAIIDEQGYVSQIKYKYNEPMKITLEGQNPFCKGGNFGSIILLMRGGIPDYTYEWSNGTNYRNAIRLKAGTYSVVVTDNKNKTITASHTLTEPKDSLFLEVTKDDISCYSDTDGKLFVNISGGVPPYYKVWSTNERTDSIVNLDEGIYGIIIQDANKCIKTDSVTIFAPENPLRIFFDTEKVTCLYGSDGIAQVNAEGGTPPYTYKWSTGDTIMVVDSLPSGKYNVVVTDAHNCFLEKTVTVSEPSDPIVIQFDITPVSCFGGENGKISTIVKGGGYSYEYLWSNNEVLPRLINQPAGQYILNVTDNLGCQVSDTAIIIQPADSISITYTHEDVSCFAEHNGSISLNVTGGTEPYTYRWQTGQSKAELTDLRAYEYFVIVKDDNYCTAEEVIVVKQPEMRLTIRINPIHVNCLGENDGKIYASIFGGTEPYTIEWNNGSTDTLLTNLSPGVYTLKVTDSNGCKETQAVEIKEPLSMLNVEPIVTNISCNGEQDGIIRLKVTGGVPKYHYRWSTGEEMPSLADLEQGTYSVDVIDSYGCKITKSMTINEPQILYVTADITNTTSNKDNGKIQLNISGGTAPYKIEWDNRTEHDKRTNLKKGRYSVKVIDVRNCKIEKDFLVE